MTYKRALEADARLAAKNALKIRAALRQTFDPKRVYEQYLLTQPNQSDSAPQNNARARAWVMLNVRVNMEALKEVMLRVWAEGYVTGEAFANEQLLLAREIKKADDTQADIDWANWQPGDRAAALLLRPPKAFQQLLESQNITFKDFSDTTVRDIGNAIGEAIELGLPAERAAKRIMTHVANPARALSIAITEQNRAISYATVNRYKEAGLEKMEWEVSSPCDKCAQNANQVMPIGQPFKSGNTQPPAHPHCRCVLLPVLPDFDDPANTAGTITAPVTTPTGVIQRQAFDFPDRPKIVGNWSELTSDEAAKDFIDRLEARGTKVSDEYRGRLMREARQYQHYRNDNVIVEVFIEGKDFPEKAIERVLTDVDDVYNSLPEWRKITNTGEKRIYTIKINQEPSQQGLGVVGFTYLGNDTIWIDRSLVVKLDQMQVDERWALGKRGFSMPTYNTTNNFKYTLAHEFGHTTDSYLNGGIRGKISSKIVRKHGDQLSQYGRTKPTEAYAEVFAEWLLGGKGEIVQAYDEAYGWSLKADDYWKRTDTLRAWKQGGRTN